MTRHTSSRGAARARSVPAPLREAHGFTLMEILIVVVILGALAGIAILVLNPFEQLARETCDEANEVIGRIEERAGEVLDEGDLDALDPPDVTCE